MSIIESIIILQYILEIFNIIAIIFYKKLLILIKKLIKDQFI